MRADWDVIVIGAGLAGLTAGATATRAGSAALVLDARVPGGRAWEVYHGPWLPEPIVTDPGPESAAELSESLTLGFLVLLDQLAPVERAVFVLADVFRVPYAEIAATVGRSEAACRQVARPARRRLRPAQQPGPAAAADRELVDGLLRALASGDVNESSPAWHRRSCA